jgi:hypothetical protein
MVEACGSSPHGPTTLVNHLHRRHVALAASRHMRLQTTGKSNVSVLRPHNFNHVTVWISDEKSAMESQTGIGECDQSAGNEGVFLNA